MKYRLQGSVLRFSASVSLGMAGEPAFLTSSQVVLMLEPHLEDLGLEELGSSKLTLSPTLEAHSPPRKGDGLGEKGGRREERLSSRSHLSHKSSPSSSLPFSWCLLPPGGSKPGAGLAVQP